MIMDTDLASCSNVMRNGDPSIFMSTKTGKVMHSLLLNEMVSLTYM